MKKVLNSPTPLDDVFRTEGEKMKEWFIPIINEAYGTSYKISQARVLLRPNEQMHEETVDADDVNQKGIPKKITDMTILVDGHIYHLECQSLEDGTIVIRLVEYGLHIAVQNASMERKMGELNVEIPRQMILYLRRREDRNPLRVNYIYDEQRIRVVIPCIPVQKYSIQELFEKKLYLLIPYYMMRYEDLFQKGTGLENEQIRSDLEEMNQRLYGLIESGEISFTYVRYLTELSQTVMKHITRKVKRKKRERLVRSMGGKVLELETDKILKKGEKRGKKIGKKIGMKIGRVLTLYEDGYTVFEIASRVKITEEEVEEIIRIEEY